MPSSCAFSGYDCCSEALQACTLSTSSAQLFVATCDFEDSNGALTTEEEEEAAEVARAAAAAAAESGESGMIAEQDYEAISDI